MSHEQTRPVSSDPELSALERVWRTSGPSGSRRDVLRWSAVAAAAGLTIGRTGPASAAPASGRSTPARFQDGDIQEDATINVPLDPYGQVVTLDPHRTVNWGPFWAIFPNVWGGLVRYDENAKVQLDLAESFTVSEDGKTYTFKIRSDAKYANGKTVVAEDFIASWKRALDPSRLSPMANFFEPVRNYRKYIQKSTDDIGFSAVDESTVEIVLSRAYTYFLSYMASYVWSVVDPEVIEKEDDEFALKDAGTGPWRFTEFDAAVQLVMEPNTEHYGGNSPSIAKIIWPFVTGPGAANTALNLYKQDEAISADVSISLKSLVERDPELSEELISIQPSGSTRVLSFDFKQPPFNDVRVRRAFGLAVDRERWANEIYEGTWTPSRSFTPPAVVANSGYEPPEAPEFDPDDAKALLEEAGFPDGEGLPPIIYYQPVEDTDDEKGRVKSFLDTITEAIGVEIEHDTTRSLEEIEQLRTDAGGKQFDIVWWWNITETPYLLSQVFTSSSPYMRGFFNWDAESEEAGDFDAGAASEEFDELAKKADIEQDQAARNDLYRQAEQLVLDNAVCVPLGNWVQQFVQKPWIQGTKQGPWTGRIPVWFDKDVVVLKRDDA